MLRYFIGKGGWSWAAALSQELWQRSRGDIKTSFGGERGCFLPVSDEKVSLKRQEKKHEKNAWKLLIHPLIKTL